jgi:hypothetical protein|tara:strand:+ start:31 stop:747 length:717 start_codon:yes stop_codon:yes gene_type:complete
MTKEKTQVKEVMKSESISVACVGTPFDIGKKELEKQGYKIISLDEAAGIRTEGFNSNDFPRPKRYASGDLINFVTEGMLYVPKKGIYITRNSPIMDFPEVATEFHRESSDFYLRPADVNRALEDSTLIYGNYRMAPCPFIDMRATGKKLKAQEIFKENGDKYIKFLSQKGYSKIPIGIDLHSYDKHGDNNLPPFVRPIFFRSSKDSSEIDGCWRGLGHVSEDKEGDRIMGIKKLPKKK